MFSEDQKGRLNLAIGRNDEAVSSTLIGPKSFRLHKDLLAKPYYSVTASCILVKGMQPFFNASFILLILEKNMSVSSCFCRETVNVLFCTAVFVGISANQNFKLPFQGSVMVVFRKYIIMHEVEGNIDNLPSHTI